ncbi:unnamed protein product [Brugia pahangi]|uniref:MSP domain-containing protein n=1 Tax=Brugia pahangi TaxID=6280 RepID=A0A0N4T0V3_BRUPA|nr:unnamed protein product [Brugia pahangi]
MVDFRNLDAGEHVPFVIRKRPDDSEVTAVIRAESTGKLNEVLLINQSIFGSKFAFRRMLIIDSQDQFAKWAESRLD